MVGLGPGGALALHPAKIDLASLLTGLVRENAEARRIRLALPPQPIVVTADPERVGQTTAELGQLFTKCGRTPSALQAEFEGVGQGLNLTQLLIGPRRRPGRGLGAQKGAPLTPVNVRFSCWPHRAWTTGRLPAGSLSASTRSARTSRAFWTSWVYTPNSQPWSGPANTACWSSSFTAKMTAPGRWRGRGSYASELPKPPAPMTVTKAPWRPSAGWEPLSKRASRTNRYGLPQQLPSPPHISMRGCHCHNQRRTSMANQQVG